MQHQIKTQSINLTINCLFCDGDIYLGRNPKVGYFILCKSCNSQFEIVDLEPIMVDWPEIKEDYVDMYGYYGDEGPYDDMDDDYETYDAEDDFSFT